MQDHPSRSGFSMIEMSLVLVVLGIMTMLLMPPIIASVKKERGTMAKNALRAVKDAIIGYAMINRQLPPNLSVLGNLLDPWGHAFHYWPDNGLTTGDICGSTLSQATQFNGMLVKSTLYNATTGTYGETSSGTGFIVASDGPDGVSGIPLTGGNPTALTNAGDDLVEYVTVSQLKTLICSPTRTPAGSELPGRTGSNTKVYSNAAAANNAQVSVSANQISIRHDADPLGSGGTTANFGACIWLDDTSAPTKGNCTAGTCSFNRTIEAYFRYNAKLESQGGFAFVVTANTNSTETNYKPCGAESSMYMAYAGSNSNTTMTYVKTPKAGVEYDLLCDAQDTALACATGDNHFSDIFWGDNSTLLDDNRHGAGVYSHGLNPTLASKSYPANQLKGREVETRIRYDRNSDGTLNTTVWVKNSNNTKFSNLDVDYRYQNSSDAVVFTQTGWVGQGYSSRIRRVKIGWTLGVDKGAPLNMDIYGSGFRFN